MIKPLIIDTREPEEFDQSHVEGALNLSAMRFMTGAIPEELCDISKDQQIILYCRSGQRSNTVMQILKSHGFTNLTNGINQQQVEQKLK